MFLTACAISHYLIDYIRKHVPKDEIDQRLSLYPIIILYVWITTQLVLYFIRLLYYIQDRYDLVILSLILGPREDRDLHWYRNLQRLRL